MYKSKKLNSAVAAVLFLIAAAFMAYGIYMIDYSVKYVHTYMGISTITFDNAFQYVVTSSSIYIGFAVVIFIGAFIILSLGRKPVGAYSEPQYEEHGKSTKAADTADTDAHPENNPYYTAPEVFEAPKNEKAEASESNHENIPESIYEGEQESNNPVSDPQSLKPHKHDAISSSMIKDIFEKK